MDATRIVVAAALVFALIDCAAAAGPADVRPAPFLLRLPRGNPSVGTPVPRLAGRNPADIVTQMTAFKSGQLPGTMMDRIAKGFSDNEIHAIAAWYEAQKIERSAIMTAHPSRRDFLKAAAAGARRPCADAGDRPGGGRRVVVVGGGFARRDCARFISGRSAHCVTLVEASPTFTACPFSNGHRRPARPQGAAVRLRQARRRSGQRADLARHRDRRPGPQRHARERRPASLRPPGAGARHRYALGRAARLHRSRRRTHAACVEGRRADAVVAPPARSDGGRRHGRDLGARQSVPLPARPLRAREPDRAIISRPRSRSRSCIILDAKDAFSKQGLFQNAWKALYPNLIEWVSLSSGGKVTSVDAGAMTLVTDFARTRPTSPMSSRRRRRGASPRLPAPPTAPAGARSIR